MSSSDLNALADFNRTIGEVNAAYRKRRDERRWAIRARLSGAKREEFDRLEELRRDVPATQTLLTPEYRARTAAERRERIRELFADDPEGLRLVEEFRDHAIAHFRATRDLLLTTRDAIAGSNDDETREAGVMFEVVALALDAVLAADPDDEGSISDALARFDEGVHMLRERGLWGD